MPAVRRDKEDRRGTKDVPVRVGRAAWMMRVTDADFIWKLLGQLLEPVHYDYISRCATLSAGW